MAQIPQARNYGIPALDYSGVSNTLATLGQQIGQGLAMREYQRQYQNTLPAIEQTMRSATQKIQAGDFTGGYAEAVGGLPLMSQNPLIAQASKSYLDSIGQVAEFQQSAMWQKLQEGRMGGATSGRGIPAAQGPSMDVGQFFPGMTVPSGGVGAGQGVGMGAEMVGVGEGADANQPDYSANPTTEPTDANTIEVIDDSGQALYYPPRGLEGGLPTNAPATQPAAQPITLGMIESNIPEGKRKEFTSLPDFVKDAVVASANFDRLAPDQKQTATNESGVTQDAMPETSEVWKDPRLAKYFPGAVGIAKPREKKELLGTGITFTSRGGVNVTTAPQVTNQNVLDAWRGAAGKPGNKEKLEQALDAMEDANMKKLFAEYKDIFSLRAAAQPEGDGFVVGTEPITKQQYDALLTLSNLPVWSEREFTPMVFKQEAPAPAAGGSVAERVRAQYGKKEGATQPATPSAAAAATATEAVEFSEDNPYAKGLPAMSQAAPRPPTSAGRGTGTRERQVAERKLKEVNEQIKNLDSYRKVGRRPSTKEERAIRWEELNEEKKRLERLLSSR
jgi:hypothetical protein